MNSNNNLVIILTELNEFSKFTFLSSVIPRIDRLTNILILSFYIKIFMGECHSTQLSYPTLLVGLFNFDQ